MSRFRDRIAGLALASLLTCLTTLGFAQPDQPPAPVNVAPVIEREIKTGQSFVGSVTPIRIATIGSAVNGRVVEFPVKEGDRVKAGDTLAQLLTETIRLEVATAEAELDLRQEELNELQAGTRREEIDQAEALMKGAKAALDFNNQNLKRNEVLFNRGTITSQVMEDVVSQNIQALEEYNNRKAAYELAKKGPRIEQIKQAEARVAMQQATVDKLKDQFRKHTIVTRFDGYIVAEFTEEGQWVNQGDSVAEVAALDQVDVLANVLESQIQYVEKGMKVSVIVPAIPDRVFEGEVALIIPRGDSRTRTFPVKIRMTNEISGGVPLLKAGMIGRVMLPTGPSRTSLLVPKDAIVLGGQQPMVYQLARESASAQVGKAVPIPVTLGVSQGSLIQITAPLKPGDLVVVRGNERLRPQQDLRIAETIDTSKLANAGD